MGYIHLITGGCRSGKSRYAQDLAESLDGSRCYIATSPVTDPEMAARIEKHKADRQDRNWHTIEQQLHLADTIGNSNQEVLLIDCITLWVNNLIYDAQQAGETIDETGVSRLATELVEACGQTSSTIIIVTNEVGLGIVPDNALARIYRDLVGRCNQVIAQGADEVTLVSCGLPLTLKKGK